MLSISPLFSVYFVCPQIQESFPRLDPFIVLRSLPLGSWPLRSLSGASQQLTPNSGSPANTSHLCNNSISIWTCCYLDVQSLFLPPPLLPLPAPQTSSSHLTVFVKSISEWLKFETLE